MDELRGDDGMMFHKVGILFMELVRMCASLYVDRWTYVVISCHLVTTGCSRRPHVCLYDQELLSLVRKISLRIIPHGS